LTTYSSGEEEDEDDDEEVQYGRRSVLYSISKNHYRGLSRVAFVEDVRVIVSKPSASPQHGRFAEVKRRILRLFEPLSVHVPAIP
jgi:hypothetical protein